MDLIIDLDHLRRKKLSGTTHPQIFFQLKNLFHTLESIGSARIEGNRTTIAEFIETKIAEVEVQDQSLIEIQNMEKVMSFIDENIEDSSLNKTFICEIHAMLVANLDTTKEGDQTPGNFRASQVAITGSEHTPPEAIHINSYMEELINFINKNDEPKYDLLKTALAHHRFAWIHPFRNGNGRTARLLTYAMLVKYGFNVHHGRILNPTAVFCSNRDDYYNFLSGADSGTEEGLLGWCEYVLSGLKVEIEKIDKLLSSKFLVNNILLPAIKLSSDRKLINTTEAKILSLAAKKQSIKAEDIRKEILTDKIPQQISRTIKGLIDNKMLVHELNKKRSYVLRFDNKFLWRSVIDMLDKEDFLPLKD